MLGADKFLMLPSNMKEDEVRIFPSPNSLKNRYILKCIRPRFIPTKNEIHDTDLPLNDNNEDLILQLINNEKEYDFTFICIYSMYCY